MFVVLQYVNLVHVLQSVGFVFSVLHIFHVSSRERPTVVVHLGGRVGFAQTDEGVKDPHHDANSACFLQEPGNAGTLRRARLYTTFTPYICVLCSTS